MSRCPTCNRPLPGRPRTLDQNSLYWVRYVESLADYTGYSKEEVHEILKAKFLREAPRDHRLEGRIRSTTELSTVEFSEYVEKVRMLALDMGLEVA